MVVMQTRSLLVVGRYPVGTCRFASMQYVNPTGQRFKVVGNMWV